MNMLNRRQVVSGSLALGALLSNGRASFAQRGPGRQNASTPVATPGDGPLDLGTTGGTSSAAFGISGSGIYVVGISNNADEDPRGFLWDGSTMLELESLGGQESEANAVNNSGLVVGSAIAGDEHRYAATFQGPVATSLGTLGGTRSRALWVNDDGLIVGESTDANEHELAFLFADGQMIGLPALPSTNPEAAALAVNISGQIVGYSVNASGKFRAVRWIGGGPAKDIAPMWQGEAMATAINDAGQIAGHVLVGGGVVQAAIWQPDGSQVLLPTEEGMSCEATGISGAGTVSGNLIDADGHRFAVRWVNETLERLPTLGGSQSNAYGISADGTIAGSSRTGPDDDESATSHAVLWPAD